MLEEFQSPDFKPEESANKLVKATLTKQDQHVDVNPAITRLKYQKEEVEQMIFEYMQQTQSTLLKYANQTKEINNEVQQLDPSLQNVTSTFKKLNQNFINPFEKAQQLHLALSNIHKLAQLSRNLSIYLQFALQVQNEEYKRESSKVDRSSGASILKNASSLRNSRKLLQDVPELLNVSTVKNFEAKLPKIESDLINAAKNLVLEYDGMHSGQLRLGSMALLNLREDIFSIYNGIVTSSINSTASKLVKGLQNESEFRRGMLDAHQQASVCENLAKLFKELVPEQQTQNAAQVQARVQAQYFNEFWPSVAKLLDQKMKTMAVVNTANLESAKQSKQELLQICRNVNEVHEVLQKYLSS